MRMNALRSYLQMHRKRLGFTHDEIAFLCGAMCGSSVARHEKGVRLPMLRTALMYEFILGASVKELYEGVFHEARDAVQTRAKGLIASLQRRRQSADRDRKLAVLQMLLADLGETGLTLP